MNFNKLEAMVIETWPDAIIYLSVAYPSQFFIGHYKRDVFEEMLAFTVLLGHTRVGVIYEPDQVDNTYRTYFKSQ